MLIFSSPMAVAVLALLAVLGLIWIGGLALRAMRPGAADGLARTLALHGVLALDSRRRVHLIGCGGHRLLLLTGGGGDVVLGWLPAEPDARGASDEMTSKSAPGDTSTPAATTVKAAP